MWIFDTVGLTVFMACVGLAAGPSFFSGLQKSGISLGMVAQAAIVFARTGADAKARGVTAFLVPLDLPGVSRSALRDLGTRAIARAVLSFDGPRHGIAAWLAAPAPMGSLDFISPEANLAAAFVVKTPAAMVDDMFAMAAAHDVDFLQHKSEFEAREGIDLKHDLAEPLGGEVAFAVDGPMLPTPSWKLIVEVYDASRLQTAIEHLLERANAEAVKNGKSEGTLVAEDSGGRPGWALTLPATGLTVHYVYTDGYLVAAPSRALVDRALQNRASGY